MCWLNLPSFGPPQLPYHQAPQELPAYVTGFCSYFNAGRCINPCSVELIWADIKIYLDFMLFLDIEQSPVDYIQCQGTQEYPHCIHVIAWLLMTSPRKEPEPQQLLYWPASLDISVFSTTRVKCVYLNPIALYKKQLYIHVLNTCLLHMVISGVILFVQFIGFLMCWWVAQRLCNDFLCSHKIDYSDEVMNFTCETNAIRLLPKIPFKLNHLYLLNLDYTQNSLIKC